jgi:H+/Cl- antiporter ClcA
MKRLLNLQTHFHALRLVGFWILLAIPAGVLAGTASALFLWALERVTNLRLEHGWLLFLLPVGGFAIGWIYHRLGKDAEGGNNVILDQIHQPGGGVSPRMAPLVLVGTLVTHLFGGSAGREGTAVQMGGSLASSCARILKLGPENLRVMLMAGVAAGFGSVFGTPLAGAVFSMEVLAIGRMQYEALIPVLAASLIGDLTCSAWGIHHTIYNIAIADGDNARAVLDFRLLGLTVIAAACFGIVSQFFSESIHLLQQGWKKTIAYAPLRPVAAGMVIIAMTYLLGTRDYLGLGVHSPDPQAVTILSAFTAHGATPWSWWWKILFTVVTLSAGFKGGEVTPLFFIGATLGNALATLTGAPVDLFAGLGFIAVFAGASNTPLACTIMGIELFGSHYAVYFAVACFVAYYFSGHTGIYHAQRIGVAKHSRGKLPANVSLREARDWTAGNKGK